MMRRRARLGGMLAVGALAVGGLGVGGLAGCAQIPTSGPVQNGNDEPAEPRPVVVVPAGPQPDSPPTQIVQDFLSAGAAAVSGGLSTDSSGASGGLDFSVARQYLSGATAASWNPLAGVLVFRSFTVEQPSPTEVDVDALVAGTVDENGVYTEAPAGDDQPVTFDLVQNPDGQWRITDAPHQLILSQSQFVQGFRQVPLYFLTPDEKYLVPDERWYPAVNLSTSAIKGLLAGPSPWLRGAVTTAVPVGVALNAESVPVDAQGQAEVDLGPADAVQSANRNLLVAQIQATLKQVTQVRSVTVRAAPDGPELTSTGQQLTTAGAVELSGTPEMIQHDEAGGERLVALAPSGDGLVPVDGVGSLTDLGARDPARSEDSTVRVMLLGEGDDTSLVLASQADRGPLLKQPNLVAPSVDQFDWVWTASGDTVSALNLEGHPEQLTASWLTGRTVLAVRASRDGTRIAVVSTGPDGTQIDVAGITRDDSGTPQTLSLSAQRVGAAVGAATAVVWTDDATLAALVIDQTSGTATVWQVPVGGPSLALPSLTGGVSLAGAGRFDRPLFVATDQGDLWQLNGLTWLPVMDVTGVRDPAYPG